MKGDEPPAIFNCFLLRQNHHSIAVNIARTMMPAITPPIIGPFGAAEGLFTITVAVSLGEAEVVDGTTTPASGIVLGA
jgi:hypothetical protein